jgi:hypothetical protein
MPKLVGTGLNQVPMNAMLGSMAFQDITSYFRAVQGTAQNSTSGTSIDFTGIPVWAKRIQVILSGVSTSGTSLIQVQIGSGSVTTTGYVSGASTNGGTNVAAGVNSTTGFITEGGGAATVVRHGMITLHNVTGNTWVMSSFGGRSDAGFAQVGGGSIALSGVLDRVRITTVNGTDTFDAGSVNIIYEG